MDNFLIDLVLVLTAPAILVAIGLFRADDKLKQILAECRRDRSSK